MPTAGTASPSCRACGYPLHGLDSRHCPECGHGFDPTDPKSMNVGRRPGRIARLLMRPVGWPTLIVMFAATAAIVATTRPQEGAVWEWKFALHDLRYYANPESWRRAELWTDSVYVVGVAMLCLALPMIVCRVVIGELTRRWFHAAEVSSFSRKAFAATLAMIGVSVLCVGYGWSYRLGATSATMRERGFTFVETQSWTRKMSWALDLPNVDLLRAIGSARRHGDTTTRWGSITLLIECDWPHYEVRRQLLDTIANDPDSALRACAIRLLGLVQSPDDRPRFVALLDSPDPQLRIAAIDALAVGRDAEATYFRVAVDPLMDKEFVQGTRKMTLARSFLDAANLLSPQPWPPNAVPRLWERVMQSTDPRERDAAAHALSLDDPSPPAKVRYVELAVWHVGTLSTDEPDAGVESLRDVGGPPLPVTARHNAAMTIDRPVIAGIQFQMVDGDIYHAAPVPDEPSVSIKERFNTSGIMTLNTVPRASWYRPPYAWLPSVASDRLSARGPHNVVISSGVAWRSLIALPTAPHWQSPPTPGEPTQTTPTGFAWLSSRSQANRLLHLRSERRSVPGVAVSSKNSSALDFNAHDVLDRDPAEDQPDFAGVSAIDAQDQTARRGRRTQRRGMYVSVVDGVATAEIVPVPRSGKPADPAAYRIGAGTMVRDVNASDVTETKSGTTRSARDSTPNDSNATRGHSPRRGGDGAAAALLRDWVIDAGLTAAEADALLADWNKSFFQTDGRRFLLLLSAVDYDSLCPIHINPKPTEMARVGIVWTEFDDRDSR